MVTTRAGFWSGTTVRVRRFKSPLRGFLRTESGGAAVLLGATAAALVIADDLLALVVIALVYSDSIDSCR
jgi:Na+/H+ antiporter NhaA